MALVISLSCFHCMEFVGDFALTTWICGQLLFMKWFGALTLHFLIHLEISKPLLMFSYWTFCFVQVLLMWRNGRINFSCAMCNFWQSLISDFLLSIGTCTSLLLGFDPLGILLTRFTTVSSSALLSRTLVWFSWWHMYWSLVFVVINIILSFLLSYNVCSWTDCASRLCQLSGGEDLLKNGWCTVLSST